MPPPQLLALSIVHCFQLVIERQLCAIKPSARPPGPIVARSHWSQVELVGDAMRFPAGHHHRVDCDETKASQIVEWQSAGIQARGPRIAHLTSWPHEMAMLASLSFYVDLST